MKGLKVLCKGSEERDDWEDVLIFECFPWRCLFYLKYGTDFVFHMLQTMLPVSLGVHVGKGGKEDTLHFSGIFFFFLGITVPKHFLMDVKQILLCNSIRSHPKKYSELEGNRMWFAFMVKDFVIFKFYMKCFVFVLKIGEGVCETSNAQKCFIFSPCQFFLTHTHIPLVKDSVMLFFPPSSSQVPSFCHVHPFLVFSMFSSIFCHYSQLEKFTKYLLILFPRVDLLILIVLGKNRVKP